ncbi:hypothetical protein [Enterocloster sp.]|uniref:hypothetical protein n=1 Tax=Enterocloster sp. TaxID=2719315 RepID=UPI0039A332BC
MAVQTCENVNMIAQAIERAGVERSAIKDALAIRIMMPSQDTSPLTGLAMRRRTCWYLK